MEYDYWISESGEEYGRVVKGRTLYTEGAKLVDKEEFDAHVNKTEVDFFKPKKKKPAKKTATKKTSGTRKKVAAPKKDSDDGS